MFGNVFSTIKEEKKNSNNVLGFVVGAFSIMFTTVAFLIIMGLSLLLPTAVIIVGAMHMNDCPAEDRIPVLLVTWAVVSAAATTTSLVQAYAVKRRSNSNGARRVDSGGIFSSMLNFASLALFIAACIFVYRTREKTGFHTDEPTDSPMYCNYTLYWLGFWVLTVNFILTGVFFVLTCCGICCAIASHDDSRYDAL